MGYWSKELAGVYVVETKEIDTTKANKFAEDMITKENDEKFLHNRYNYERKDRVEKNVIGKYGEEAFKIFMNEICNLDFTVDYEKWEGSRVVDSNDAFISGYNIDVKFSRDNQNRGITKCYKQLNFMVPKTQTVKDITVWGFCDINMEKFYILAWIDKETYMENYTTAVWDGVPNYKLPLREGHSIPQLVGQLLWNA